MNLEVVREFLAVWPDVQLVEAMSGYQAIRQARESGLDLFLIDINLPDINGIDVLHELRRESLTHGMPCIALSAVALNSQIRRAVAAGFDGYVTKPIVLEHFLAVIQSALAKPPAHWR